MNQFEGIAKVHIEAMRQRELLAQASMIERQAEIAQEELRQERVQQLAIINAQRRLTHDGNTPNDIWGPEAQSLCDDFLEFTGMVASSGVQFSTARIMKPETQLDDAKTKPFSLFRRKPVQDTVITPDDWHIKAYGIGYTRGYVSSKSGFSIDRGLDRTASKTYGTIPICDVHLCIDGLVRANNSPMDLADLEGSLEQPLIGEFKIISNVHYLETTTYGTGDAEYHHRTREEMIAREFQEMPAIDGLRTVLTRHAVEIALEREK